MFKSGYRYLASLMLVVYVSVAFATDLISITCSCEHHHGADHHTAFLHVHECEVHDHECCGVSLSDSDCCGHDHSTELELYTQPRVDDDQQGRLYQLLAVVTDSYLYCEDSSESGSYNYGEYLLPQISQVLGAGKPLRAPPVLV